MGALFSSPPSPPPIPVPPPAAAPATMATAPTKAAPVVQTSGAQGGKAGAAAMAGGTIGTSPQGLSAPPTTANANLLGGTQ